MDRACLEEKNVAQVVPEICGNLASPDNLSFKDWASMIWIF